MRRRTGRLFLTMLLPLVLLLTGLAGNCLARPYPAGFDPAAVPPEVSSSEGAAKTVALGAQTLPFSDDVEAGPGSWTATGLWHRVVSPQSIRVIDAIRQNYVQLPDAGYLPSAYSGSACWWFGEDATGTFIGPNYPTQSSNSGGTSATTLSGTLVSPAINLTNASQASLSFYTWWEIEGVDVHAYDKMYVEVSTDGGTTFSTVGTLNPIDDANTASYIAYSTNGVNVPGEWGKVYFNLTPYLGNEIKLRFRFNTVDHRYNGFRGWFIDDVKVTATAIPTLTLTSFEPGVASPGQLITLHGTGFQDAATIKIGGFNAESAVIFHDKILVYVPQLTSGTYQVVVQNPSGASASLPGLVISTATAPTIGTVSPALLDCSSTAGGVLTVNGTDFVSGATVKLDNTALSGVLYVSSSELRANLPTSLGAGNHNITVTNPDGLSFTKFAALNVNGAAAILGSVTSGTPVASARISYSGPVSGTVYTGVNGSYEIDGLINGNYNLTVSKAGLTTATRAVTISACGTSTQNFALTSATGTLTGRVTATSNGAGISGATVTITGGATRTTDANGYYSFTGLAAGTYTATAAKTGYVSASAPAAVVAGSTYTLNFPLNSTYLHGKVTTTAGTALSGVTVTITGGATRTTNATGYYAFANIPAGTYSVTASKTGYVSQTTTGAVVSVGTAKVVSFSLAVPQTLATLNGKVLYATTGQPAAGVTVTLTGGATRSTDATGAYSFAGLAAGSYSITFSKSGYLTQTVGPYSAAAGATTTVDHDLHLNCLSGRVVSATGTPLAAATVTITGGATRTTDPAGYYTFWDFAPGTYSITAAKTGYVSKTVSNVYLTGGTNKVVKLALAAQPVTQLTGRVTNAAGTGVTGATVTVTGGATATTDSNGNYSFSSIAAGTYTVTASKTGYISQTATGVQVAAGAVKTQNFILNVLNGTLLTGRVTVASGAGLAGATVAITGGATRTTDANGYYSFVNIAAATYTVTVSKTGYLTKTVYGAVVSTGVTKTVNVTLNSTVLTGRVTISSGAGLAGATVTITGGATRTTDANGYYTFTDIAAGTYSVTASKTGYATKTFSGAIVAAGTTRTVNLTLYTTVLTGRVISSGAGLAGATVTITGGATRTTDAGGYYTFNNIAAGTYSVTASKTGYIPQTTAGVVVATAVAKTVNFTLNSTVLSGRVTIASGAGLAGVTITITGGATRTTDANGYYSFINIAAGTYSVSAAKVGYITQTSTGVAVVAGGSKVVNFLLAPALYGNITGIISDAVTGSPILGATVSVGTGSASATTNSLGVYTLSNVLAGSHTVTASKSGYVTNTRSVTVVPETTQTAPIALSPIISAGNGDYRVILSWGATPLDVDSHLYVPNGSGMGHVYYASRGSSILFPFANLDLDDRDGYGPETITIVQNQPGVYQYWVYNWSGTPALGTSGATVKLYDANSVLATFTVPTSATGRAWHVFDLNAQTGAITTVDTVQASLPTFSTAKTVSRNGVNYVAGTEPKD